MGLSKPRLSRHPDSGMVALEVVLMVPVVVLLCLIVVQAVEVWQARNVAEAAAQNGLRAARVYQGTASDGQKAAAQYVRDTAGHLLSRPQISAARGSNVAVVRVHGNVSSVLRFATFSVTESAQGPIERFSNESG